MSSVKRVSAAPSVLFVLPDLGKNGAVQQTILIAEGVAATGAMRSTVFCLDLPRHGAKSISVPLRGTIRTDLVPFLRRMNIVSRIISKSHAIHSILRLIFEARKHDVIFASFEAGSALAHPAWAARALQKPFCVIVHSNIRKSLAVHFPGWPLEKTKAILIKADHIVCVSDGLEAILRDLLKEDIPQHSTIRNGVDIRSLGIKFQMPPCCSRDSTLKTEERFFLAVGRISHEKGLDLLIEAHAKARNAGEDHALVIAGDGPETLKSRLHAQVSEMGVSETVRFIGHCDNPIGLMRQAYGFCLTSRYEGFSLALAEAAAVGTPCIAMDCVAGPREILEGGKYGTLVPNGDVDAMADAMIAHLRDPNPLCRKAAASRSDAQRLDTAPMIGKYVELINNIVAR